KTPNSIQTLCELEYNVFELINEASNSSLISGELEYNVRLPSDSCLQTSSELEYNVLGLLDEVSNGP
ncbi:11260_t:CDS:2, partial [Racocetra persica]